LRKQTNIHQSGTYETGTPERKRGTKIGKTTQKKEIEMLQWQATFLDRFSLRVDGGTPTLITLLLRPAPVKSYLNYKKDCHRQPVIVVGKKNKKDS
jgi:hypothetical protein